MTKASVMKHVPHPPHAIHSWWPVCLWPSPMTAISTMCWMPWEDWHHVSHTGLSFRQETAIQFPPCTWWRLEKKDTSKAIESKAGSRCNGWHESFSRAAHKYTVGVHEGPCMTRQPWRSVQSEPPWAKLGMGRWAWPAAPAMLAPTGIEGLEDALFWQLLPLALLKGSEPGGLSHRPWAPPYPGSLAHPKLGDGWPAGLAWWDTPGQ